MPATAIDRIGASTHRRRRAAAARRLCPHAARQRLQGRPRRDPRRARDPGVAGRQRGRRRSSRRCARCSAPPTPTGSASTRSSTPIGAAHGMRRQADARAGSRQRAQRRCGASAEAAVAAPHGLPDHVERRAMRDGDDAAEPGGRREGASRAENLATTDMRHIVDPDDDRARRTRSPRGWRGPCGRGWCAASRRGGADGGSTCAAPSIATCRTAARRSSSVWRRRKIKPLRLVVLLDASGSMNLYTAFFVRFLHGVVDAFREAEAFVFHTRLAHVSPSLRDRDVTRAVDRLALMAQGIGGGTRIGESLATFNRWHARRVINSRTAVMIVSDGYDTGEPERLGRRDAAPAPPLPPHHLAQSADRLARLQPAGARHAGGAALCRSVRARPQPREPGGARAVSREDLTPWTRKRHPRSSSPP